MEFRVKQEPAHINTHADWKLHRDVECRVILERIENISSEILPLIEPVNAPSAQTSQGGDSEQSELSEIYLRVMQCDQDCETCQNHIRELSEHVRTTHAAGQLLTRDPLFIDPIDMDQSSAIEMNREVDEDIERMACSKESETDLDFNIESGISREPDYTSPVMTRRGRGKRNSEMRFKCTDCGQGYTAEALLTIHMRTHTRNRPIKCRECDQSFTHRANLCLHMRSHTRVERRFECYLCHKSFASEYSLMIHIRCHTGERPFQCTDCTKSFSIKSNLVRHMRTHARKRRFQCTDCAKSFSTKGHLVRHTKSH